MVPRHLLSFKGRVIQDIRTILNASGLGFDAIETDDQPWYGGTRLRVTVVNVDRDRYGSWRIARHAMQKLGSQNQLTVNFEVR